MQFYPAYYIERVMLVFSHQDQNTESEFTSVPYPLPPCIIVHPPPLPHTSYKHN